MATIATYREVRFDGKRQFELSEEEIHVWGSINFQTDVDTTIPLKVIQPRVIRVRIRNVSFTAGVVCAGALLATRGVLVSGFGMEPLGEASQMLLAGIFGSLALAAATIRKVEFARFVNDAEIAVLDVARSGPDAASFDKFVAQIVDQVRAARMDVGGVEEQRS